MLTNNFIKNIKFFLYAFLYLSLITGFVLDENSSGGALYDFKIIIEAVKSFSINLISTYENYNSFTISHYPYYYIFLAFLFKLTGSVTFIKLTVLHLSLFLPLVFYQILKFKYPSNKKYIAFVPGLLFLSPFFRSSAIWALNDNLALIFFSLSILYFLKALYSEKKDKTFRYVLYNLFFIVCATYTRQYYAVFGIFFFYNFLIKFNFKIICYYILFGLILISPIIYQFFDPNLGHAFNFFSHNLVNNFILLSTIFIIYLVPFYFNLDQIKKLISFYKKKLFLLFLLFLFSIFLIYFFDYNTTFIDKKKVGGGVIYKIFFRNDIFFLYYTIFFLSVLVFVHFCWSNIKQNFMVIIFFFGMFPLGYIFQKYLDPSSLIIIFCLFESKFLKKYIEDLSYNIKYLYAYFLILYFGSIFQYYVV